MTDNSTEPSEYFWLHYIVMLLGFISIFPMHNTVFISKIHNNIWFFLAFSVVFVLGGAYKLMSTFANTNRILLHITTLSTMFYVGFLIAILATTK